MPASVDGRRRTPAVIASVLLGLITAGLWLLAGGPATADVDGDAETGRELFASNCAACHGPAAQGAGSAPALAGVTERLGPEQVARTIREGRGGMPAFGNRLDEAQIADLVAHLETLQADEVADGRERSRGPTMHGRGRDMMGDWSWGIALPWLVVALVVLILIGTGVVLLARRAGTAGSQARRGLGDPDP